MQGRICVFHRDPCRCPQSETRRFYLDSSFGFSRRAAEVAEYAEKLPKTVTFAHNTYLVTTENEFPQQINVDVAGVPVFPRRRLCKIGYQTKRQNRNLWFFRVVRVFRGFENCPTEDQPHAKSAKGRESGTSRTWRTLRETMTSNFCV